MFADHSVFAPKIRDKLLFLFYIPLMRIMINSCHFGTLQRIQLQSYNLNKEKTTKSYTAHNQKEARGFELRSGAEERHVLSVCCKCLIKESHLQTPSHSPETLERPVPASVSSRSQFAFWIP